MKLPPEHQKKIEARANKLIAEEMSLRELRKAVKMTQETLAELLDMRQGDISKFET